MFLIYAIGGVDGSGHTLGTVSKYDPMQDTWIEVRSMHLRKYDMSIAVSNGYLYAVGSGPTGILPVNVNIALKDMILR